MGKNQSASNLTNIVKYDNNGNLTFVSGSSTLLSVSSSGALTTTSTITAQTIVVQTITSSIDFITGSTKTGTLSSNTHQFTGSLLVTGSVGIGTPTPSALLHIRPSTNLNSPSLGSGTGSFFLSSANQLYGLYMGTAADGHSWLQNTRNDASASAYPIALNPNGGNVGIGTSSPGAKLDIPGTSDGDQIISMGSNTVSGILNSVSNLYINADSDNNSSGAQIQFGVNRTAFTGGTALMTLLETGGNVGIGTTSPLYKLSIDSTAADWSSRFAANAGSESCYLYLSHGSGYGMAIDSTTNANGTYLFKVAGGSGGNTNRGGVEYLRVGGDGAMEMGTSGTRSYIRMGRFSNSLNNTGEAWIGRASDRSQGVMTVQLGGSTNTNFEVVDRGWTTVAFSVLGNGNYSFAGSNISDRRRKTNINYIETNQLDSILKLKPVTFNKITANGTSANLHTGFIAQDILEENIPNLVMGNEEEGYGLDYDGILALAIKAIQELKAEIDELKNNK